MDSVCKKFTCGQEMVAIYFPGNWFESQLLFVSFPTDGVNGGAILWSDRVRAEAASDQDDTPEAGLQSAAVHPNQTMQSISISAGSAAEGGGREKDADHKERGARGLARRKFKS